MAGEGGGGKCTFLFIFITCYTFITTSREKNIDGASSGLILGEESK